MVKINFDEELLEKCNKARATLYINGLLTEKQNAELKKKLHMQFVETEKRKKCDDRYGFR